MRCIISVFIRIKGLSKFNTEEDSASEASTGSLGFKRRQSWFYFLENFCLKINGINKGASIK